MMSLFLFLLTWFPFLTFGMDRVVTDLISSNQTITSPGKVFELGFFNPASSQHVARWYLGIWYKSPKSYVDYVWVANRDEPLWTYQDAVLRISGNQLEIRNQSNTLVWWKKLNRRKTTTPVVAELQDNGNFMLRYKSGNILDESIWQSFDFPTDTLLPEMKIGWTKRSGVNRILRSWKTLDDPSSGEYTYAIDTAGGLPQRFIRKGVEVLNRVDSWNGVGSIGLPATIATSKMEFYFRMTDKEITYSFRLTDEMIYSNLKMSSTGILDRFARTPTAQNWVMFWSSPTDMCDVYAVCGPYSQCDINATPMCQCIKGFRPRNKEAWRLQEFSGGCIRHAKIYCNSDGFHHLRRVKLPDQKSVVVKNGIASEDCRKVCIGFCNCTGYAYEILWNGAGPTCLIWTEEILDLRIFFSYGQDLHVRVAHTDLGDNKSITNFMIGLIVAVAVLCLSIVVFSVWKRVQIRARAVPAPVARPIEVITSRRYLSGDNEDSTLPRMQLSSILMATEDFSDDNKLGAGGFGIVYKGSLVDGTLIAVKRLSKLSLQGTMEFENEVRLIAKLQHINLVRLLGFCVEMGENILVYEYLENLSLDTFLFDKSERSMLDWPRRFDIIKGIAQGIQYLHQESRLRIIHRDLKASNILLDKDMIPKISDFGMARIIGRDETEVHTRKVVETFGYMAPEYSMDGVFSMKSDVFSFGVLLLELLSGKRNRGFSNLDGDTSLLNYVWRSWEEGNWQETIAACVGEIFSSTPSASQEVLTSLEIGLLCVQEDAIDRPMMSSVVMLLGSEAAIPTPKPPGYNCRQCVGRRTLEIGSSSAQPTTDDGSASTNVITVSQVEPR